MNKISLLLLLALLSVSSFAQVKWHNPQNNSFNPLEGQWKPNEQRVNFYSRLPDTIKSLVRKPVWHLATHTAGISINFKTNSPNIIVRYTTTSKSYSLPHMPSTGVSGVDLYAKDKKGDNIWLAAKYNFADTVAFNYTDINYRDSGGYEYRLFLPTYNGVKWLEIGVDDGANFDFIKPRKKLPIVAYGTSITQGACASRPGMIWSSILSRKMDMPLYNFGFSGNGRLEDVLIDAIADIDAEVYIIDCMPNLQALKQQDLVALIVKQIKRLRVARPNTPIIITDHLGYPHSDAYERFAKLKQNSIKSQKIAFDKLIADGVTDIYHLDYDTIALPNDATVEAIHPSDWGMHIYAEAYEKMIRMVLEK